MLEIVRNQEAPRTRVTWNRRHRRYREVLVGNQPEELARVLGELQAVRADKRGRVNVRRTRKRVFRNQHELAALHPPGRSVVLPSAGVGWIRAIETIEVLQRRERYYRVEFAGGGCTWVPLRQADEVGLRPVMSAARAEQTLRTVASQRPPALGSSWSRRRRGARAMMRRGDLDEGEAEHRLQAAEMAQVLDEVEQESL